MNVVYVTNDEYSRLVQVSIKSLLVNCEKIYIGNRLSSGKGENAPVIYIAFLALCVVSGKEAA